MKQIIFIQHAADRLKERGISEDLVKETIRNPEKIDLKHERKIVQKLIDGMLLRVIYEEEEAIVVISDYRTSQVDRYLKG
jgi:hypothetical protein